MFDIFFYILCVFFFLWLVIWYKGVLSDVKQMLRLDEQNKTLITRTFFIFSVPFLVSPFFCICFVMFKIYSTPIMREN